MPKGGLEPPRVAPYAPQTYVSTNSTTSAKTKFNVPTQTLVTALESGKLLDLAAAQAPLTQPASELASVSRLGQHRR